MVLRYMYVFNMLTKMPKAVTRNASCLQTLICKRKKCKHLFVKEKKKKKKTQVASHFCRIRITRDNLKKIRQDALKCLFVQKQKMTYFFNHNIFTMIYKKTALSTIACG